MNVAAIQQLIYLFVTIVLIGLAISVKFLRKTIGLLFVILGALACLTFIGLVIGIPAIIIGGILLFV